MAHWFLLAVICSGLGPSRDCGGVEVPAATREECLQRAADMRATLVAGRTMIWQECQSAKQRRQFNARR